MTTTAHVPELDATVERWRVDAGCAEGSTTGTAAARPSLPTPTALDALGALVATTTEHERVREPVGRALADDQRAWWPAGLLSALAGTFLVDG